MKSDVRFYVVLFYFILFIVCIEFCSCVSMRPRGYYEPVDFEPVVIEKRVKIVQYWRGGIPGYYYEYPSGSLGSYRWYDTGEVIWDYPIE